MKIRRAITASALAAFATGIALAWPNATAQRPQTAWVTPSEGLVLSWISVLDAEGNPVSGLARNDFHIWENESEQKIEHFAANNEAVSVGILLGRGDNTGTPAAFLKTTSWPEEYFILLENRTTPKGGTVIQSFTTDFQKLPDLGKYVTNTAARGTLATPSITINGLYVGLDYIKEAANHRKVLLLVGAGAGDLMARPGLNSLQPGYVLNRAVREDAQIYVIEPAPANIEDIHNQKQKKNTDPQYGENYFESVARATGGRAYIANADSAADMEKITSEIARGLELQYLIGFRSTSPATDGKWRKIRVSVTPHSGSTKLTVWTRTGYYPEKNKPPGVALH
jgi:VWFA-related protein